MKRFQLFFLVAFLVVSFMVIPSCKNGDVGQTYTLIVNISAGVIGSPSTGTFTYSQGDQVNYSYTLQSGYSNLVVTLDGSIVAPSGIINMVSDRTLSATAVSSGGDFDIRGAWSLTESYPPDAPQTQTFTFTGSKTSGTVAISTIASASGTYTVTGSSVSFNFSYVDGDSGATVTHSFSGSFTDQNHMSGTSQITGVSDPDVGTWTASR